MASVASAARNDTKPKGKTRRVNVGRAVTYTILILGAFIAVSPFLWMISGSLMNLTEATGRAMLPSTPHFENYEEAWNDANFSDYFVNSVIIATLTVTGTLIFSGVPPSHQTNAGSPGSTIKDTQNTGKRCPV